MTFHGKIIIIGAGISGLVAGILLREAGIEVEIFERYETIKPFGAGIGIWPNGSEVLLSLLCADKIAALSAVITDDFFSDANGNTLNAMSRKAFQQINGFPVMNICRGELHEILLAEFGAENIHFGMKCVTIQNSNLHASVQMENGDKHTADLIIGADGIYSSVRKNILPETKLHYAGYIQLLGILRGMIEPKHQFVLGKNRYSMVFPIPDNRYMFYQALPCTEDMFKKQQTRQNQIALFRGWSQEVDNMLDAYERSLQDTDLRQHFFCDQAYYSLPLTTWHHQRIVLIGDAAHPMGSIYGLAAGVGIEDAYTLSKCLLHHADIGLALEAYEAFQRPRATAFQELEQETTTFLLHADEKQYNDFLMNVKLSTTETFNQRLISLLQGTYKNVRFT